MVSEVFVDRLLFLILGAILGFTLGFFFRVIFERKDQVREKFKKGSKTEKGLISLQTVALALVVLMVAYAAVQSQISANRSTDAADQVRRTQMCTDTFVAGTLQALNERTTFSQEQSEANIELTEAQAALVGNLSNSSEIQNKVVTMYFDALGRYQRIIAASSEKAAAFPYPAPTDFRQCITEGLSND